MDTKKINTLISDVMQAIPPGVKQIPEEFQTMLHSAMLEVFHKMELVTREEFDVQTKVLMRTREKLEALQKRLEELEK
jgi:BMFP domain-containing protein YqiC